MRLPSAWMKWTKKPKPLPMSVLDTTALPSNRLLKCPTVGTVSVEMMSGFRVVASAAAMQRTPHKAPLAATPSGSADALPAFFCATWGATSV